VVPKFASASVQDVLPSAALELIEKPSGRVTVAPRSSVGEGMVGLNCWGTERLTSIPDAESVALVVGCAYRLGLKLSWSHPVISGQAWSA